MKDSKTTRRDFVVGFGLAAGAGSLGLLGCPPGGSGGIGGTGGGGGGGGGGEVQPSGGIGIRRDVTSGDAAAQLDAYRAAVATMKARPSSDPTSWRAQAEIHENFCPHGNAFFLPWHRAYLSYFERICRTAANDPDFALPYWDWSTQPAIPDAFWSGTLNDTTRSIGQGTPIPATFVGPTRIAAILGISDFETFASRYVSAGCTSGTSCQRQGAAYGELEGVPHNNVHGRIGGNMGAFMSPLDPIFWLHHCNVDRLWMEWNKTHANGTNPEWRAFNFQGNFVDPAGSGQGIAVEDTFSTLDLAYRYDTQPTADLQDVRPSADGTVVATAAAENSTAATAGEALLIPVPLPAEVVERLQAVADPSTEAMGTSTVRLTIGGVRSPGAPVAVHVFLGAAEAPASADSPSFVRSFGFFPAEGEHVGEHGADTFLFDVGADLARLADSWDPASGDLPVHVRTEPLVAGTEAMDAVVTPSSVKLEVIEV